MKEFNCEKCNYTTNDKRNYHRHLKSKKHCQNTLLSHSINNNTNDNGEDNNNIIFFVCNYCDKNFAKKRYLTQHLHRCKEKIASLETKDDLLFSMFKKIEEKDKMLENTQQKVIERDQIILQEKTKVEDILREGTKALQKNNHKIYKMSMKNQNNLKFILEHFQDAPDVFFPDDIEDKLYQNMGKYMEMDNPVMAISKAFLDFIPRQPQEKRFIHGIDISRVKYVVKKDGKWNVDYYAKEVIPKFVFHFKKSCGKYVKTELKNIRGTKIYDRISFMDGLDSKILSNKVARNVSYDLQLDKSGYLKRMIDMHKPRKIKI